MRLLLDESLPRPFGRLLVGHDVDTVVDASWAGLTNSKLLEAAQHRFDCLLTADQSLAYQQNLPRFAIAVVVLRARTNRVADLTELIAQEVGTGAMTASLLKQVLVMLLRRSLSSMGLWVERFATPRDPAIARAFASMLARPNAPHSVRSLSRTGGLSRSAFMVRFNASFGDSPMTILRKLRMRRAALLLAANDLQIEKVARDVGYASRSSFIRAFRNSYGMEPKEYREMSRSATDRANPGERSGATAHRRKDSA